MHAYLRAIGFSSTFSYEREVELLLDNLFHTCDDRKVVRSENSLKAYMELSKSFGPNMGIRLVGEMDDHGFHRLGYFPYMTGRGVTTTAQVNIEPRSDGAGYYGMADEGRVGISLIFSLQNPGQYRSYIAEPWMKMYTPSTSLAALSLSGSILLPMKNDDETHGRQRAEFYERHDDLVRAAKNGSQEAVESLTLEDMDTYAMITRRLQYEDILSIVDTYLMPYGMESDIYQMMGVIRFYTKVRNTLTKEYVYQMTVECNGMIFDVCINEKDLLGDPEIGRRFKGNIWLQGSVEYTMPQHEA